MGTKKSHGGLGDLLGLPYHFAAGYIVGLLAPAAAGAAIVLGVRLLTGKVPFLSQPLPPAGTFDTRTGGAGEQHLSFKLMAPEQAKEGLIREKDRIGGELNKVGAELQALTAEARTKAKGALPEKD
jgi:hypothetical protein